MTDDARLHKRYAGSGAARYDGRRLSSKRGLAESATFTRFFERVRPRSVLDCPFGTGRWIDWYRKADGPIVGLDISGDMLAVARGKLQDDPMPNLLLRQEDIFAADLSEYRALGIDLIVCTRFLNWISKERVEQVLAKFASLEAPHAIIGVSVRPSAGSPILRARMMMWSWFRKLQKLKTGGAKQYVHDEREILRLFASHGWRVVAKEPIFENETRQNWFYLLDCK